MKTLKFLSLILIAVVLSGCSKYLFTLTTNEEDNIDIYHNYVFVGSLDSGDTIKVLSPKHSHFNAINRKMKFKGSIKYYPVEGKDFSLDIKEKENIDEIRREKTLDPKTNKEREVYHLMVGTVKKSEIEESNGFGYLNLTSNEQDVEVFIDNEKIGTIADVPFNKKIPAGDHVLMVRKKFFKPIAVKIDVNDKEILPYNFELVKASGWIEDAPDEAKTNQARGNLTIATEMSDFIVIIEGIEKPAPFHLKDMPAGVYRLGIRCEDFEKDLEVTIDIDRTTFIDLDDLYNRN